MMTVWKGEDSEEIDTRSHSSGGSEGGEGPILAIEPPPPSHRPEEALVEFQWARGVEQPPYLTNMCLIMSLSRVSGRSLYK